MKYTLLMLLFLFNGRALGLNSLECDSCLYLYQNIANCINCKANLPKIQNKIESYNNMHLFYILEESYKGKGDKLLSEMNHKLINSKNIIYSDSLIHEITGQIKSNSWVLYCSQKYYIVFDVDKVDEFNVNEARLIQPLYKRYDHLKNETISNQLSLSIIEKDTFVIDLILSKIYKNGKLLGPDLYVWDVPGLTKASLSGIDSVNAIYKVQIDNIVKANMNYLLFCTANQFVQNGNNIDAYPKTIILSYRTDDLNSLNDFIPTIVTDNGGCFYDDYSILGINNNNYIVSECGEVKLCPKISLIQVQGDNVVMSKPLKLKMDKQQRLGKGYTADLGNDIIYFIYSNKIQIVNENNGEVIDVYDFSDEIVNDTYIIAATNIGNPDNKILLQKKDQYVLKNNYSDFRKLISCLLPWIVVFDDDSLGQCVSNCFYSRDSSSFVFINSLGEFVQVSFL